MLEIFQRWPAFPVARDMKFEEVARPDQHVCCGHGVGMALYRIQAREHGEAEWPT
ncbi:hypothetical protein RM192_12065 [Novosphingobium sp. MMS21-SN21R]|nr:hypothetical protein [Novosphingobium sp. MMS21-SN21R]MDT0508732.1 hypothetical protein [Novosphingobium sp. MMS21-SN21R]